MGFFASGNPVSPGPAPNPNLGYDPDQANAAAKMANGGQRDGHVDIVDPNAYNVGGSVGSAQAGTDRLQGMSGAAEGRQGPQIDNTNFNADRGLDDQSRGNQDYGLGQLTNLINGHVPSAAMNQLQQSGQAAQNRQLSFSAGARGGGASLAAAGRAGAEGVANVQAGTDSSGRLLRAHEIAGAQAQWGAAAAAQRMADLQRSGLSADQARAQAKLEQDQRTQNDAYSGGLEGLGQKLTFEQQQAQQSEEEQNTANLSGSSHLAEQGAARNAARNAAQVDQAAGLAAGGLAAGASAYQNNTQTPGKPPPDATSDRGAKTNIKGGGAAVSRMLDKLSGGR